MMENHGYHQIIGNTKDAPYINWLAAHNPMETNYFGVTHPSLPNYLATLSGSFRGIWDDCPCGSTVPFGAPNKCAPEEFIPGPVTARPAATSRQAPDRQVVQTGPPVQGPYHRRPARCARIVWKAYMQSIPSTGSQVANGPTKGP